MNQGKYTYLHLQRIIGSMIITAAVMIGLYPTVFQEKQNDTHEVNKKVVVRKVAAPSPLPKKTTIVLSAKDTFLLNRVKPAESLFHPIIIQAADRHRIDPALIKAIILAESEYNPRAISKKGARGLMQLMPRTASELGVKDAFDPELNIDAGVKYFKQLLDRFDGNIELALAAYNAGSKKVRKYRGVPPFKETKHYIKKVFNYYEYYKKKMA